MARFLTYEGKVVVDESGRGNVVDVLFRGEKDFVSVPAQDWRSRKKFEYFDANQVKRKKALDMYEAAQKTKGQLQK